MNQNLSGWFSSLNALEVIFNVVRSINPRFTYLLTLCKMSSKSDYNFLSNEADKQTNQQNGQLRNFNQTFTEITKYVKYVKHAK